MVKEFPVEKVDPVLKRYRSLSFSPWILARCVEVRSRVGKPLNGFRFVSKPVITGLKPR